MTSTICEMTPGAPGRFGGGFREVGNLIFELLRAHVVDDRCMISDGLPGAPLKEAVKINAF